MTGFLAFLADFWAAVVAVWPLILAGAALMCVGALLERTSR